MTRFLKKLCLFFIIWIPISITTDIIVTRIIRSSNARIIVVWEDIVKSNINADIIVLGSSRADCAYNPAVLEKELGEKCYNLAMYGKTVDMDIARYNLYKQYTQHKPYIIIWDVFHNTFCYSGRWMDEQFTPYVFHKEIWNSICNKRHEYCCSDRIIPLLRYWKRTGIFHYSLHSTFDTCIYNGYCAQSYLWDPHTLTDLNKIEDNSIECSYNDTLIKEFNNTLNEMNNDCDNIFLVFSPLYYDGQAKIKDLNNLVSFFAKLAEKNNCMFLNYLEHPICKDSTLFHNAEHLNSSGANIFSAILAHDLDSILKNNKKTTGIVAGELLTEKKH